jgi:hypothetical protein
MTVPETILISAGTLLVGFGTAWGTLKSQVKGTQRDVESLCKRLDERDGKIFDKLDDINQRLSNIEGWRNGKCS